MLACLCVLVCVEQFSAKIQTSVYEHHRTQMRTGQSAIEKEHNNSDKNINVPEILVLVPCVEL